MCVSGQEVCTAGFFQSARPPSSPRETCGEWAPLVSSADRRRSAGVWRPSMFRAPGPADLPRLPQCTWPGGREAVWGRSKVTWFVSWPCSYSGAAPCAGASSSRWVTVSIGGLTHWLQCNATRTNHACTPHPLTGSTCTQLSFNHTGNNFVQFVHADAKIFSLFKANMLAYFFSFSVFLFLCWGFSKRAFLMTKKVDRILRLSVCLSVSVLLQSAVSLHIVRLSAQSKVSEMQLELFDFNCCDCACSLLR